MNFLVQFVFSKTRQIGNLKKLRLWGRSENFSLLLDMRRISLSRRLSIPQGSTGFFESIEVCWN